MLQRIAWTEAAQPRVDADAETQDNNHEIQGDEAHSNSDPINTSLEENRCDLIWEGEVLERAFSAFRAKNCPTDTLAKDVLGPKLCSRWDAAKNWKPEDIDSF
jgi:U4/U6 small nuclear ribonucleoprotein PRP3